jgi:hypothetical protein
MAAGCAVVHKAAAAQWRATGLTRDDDGHCKGIADGGLRDTVTDGLKDQRISSVYCCFSPSSSRPHRF